MSLGPWFCHQCRGERQTVHRPLKSNTDDVHRAEASVSVGNFIRGESNLVMQSTRSSRYTEKFRAGVVQRILDGNQSLSQIAEELDVPQPDLLVWMAHQFDQKQQQIEQLSRTVQQLSEFAPEQARLETKLELESRTSDFATDEEVIDGRVNRD